MRGLGGEQRSRREAPQTSRAELRCERRKHGRERNRHSPVVLEGPPLRRQQPVQRTQPKNADLVTTKTSRLRFEVARGCGLLKSEHHWWGRLLRSGMLPNFKTTLATPEGVEMGGHTFLVQ